MRVGDLRMLLLRRSHASEEVPRAETPPRGCTSSPACVPWCETWDGTCFLCLHVRPRFTHACVRAARSQEWLILV